MTEPTVIAARMARSFQFSMFDDLLTDYPGVTFTRPAPVNGVTTLTFSADLDAATVTAIRDRMTSRDDADQAARATLRIDRDALDPTDPLRRLYDYVLGEAP